MFQQQSIQVNKMSRSNKVHWRKIWSILGILTASLRFLTGNKTQFSLLEPSINFSYHSTQIVPIWLAILFAPILPTITVFIFCLLRIGHSPDSSPQPAQKPKSWDLKLRLKDLHHAWLGIGYAILFAFGISNALEKFAGQPRPDLIARCQVDPQVYLNETIMLFRAGVVDSSVCRQTDSFILDEGFASFPSGHSSVDFAGLTYLSLFLALRLSILNPCHHTYTGTQDLPIAQTTRKSKPLFRLLIVFLPLAIAISVSVTRVLDNRHHPSDVLAGSLLGIGSAWNAYWSVLLPYSRRGEVRQQQGVVLGVVESVGRGSEEGESLPLARMRGV
ncbi:phosphatidic acid phosphatase type 2/haloperoxidase [Cadophora sp. MPI-SDFR-AT-0126]|nr:phosphatidic acid phosphatase type 2/haloperoxidase [Leotiomycetes sp. MPI-SDFR-AT-0126]